MPEREAMVRWLRVMWDAMHELERPGESANMKYNRLYGALRTVHNIAWQRVRTDTTSEQWPELDEGLRSALRVAEVTFSTRAGEKASPNLDTITPDEAEVRYGKLHLGRVCDYTGTHVYYSYEKNIWDPHRQEHWMVADSMQSPDVVDGEVSVLPRAKIDFTTQPPTLQGKAASRAEWLTCAPLTREEQEGQRRYLKLARASGRVVLLRSFVPADATRARIRLRQEKAARWPLPRGGRVSVAIHIPEIAFLVERDVHLDGGAWTFELDRADFARCNVLTIEVSVLRANTTHRIDYLEVEWEE